MRFVPTKERKRGDIIWRGCDLLRIASYMMREWLEMAVDRAMQILRVPVTGLECGADYLCPGRTCGAGSVHTVRIWQ